MGVGDQVGTGAEQGSEDGADRRGGVFKLGADHGADRRDGSMVCGGQPR